MTFFFTMADGERREFDLGSLKKSEVGVYVLRTSPHWRDIRGGAEILATLKKLADKIREATGDPDAIVLLMDERDSLEAIKDKDLAANGLKRVSGEPRL